MNPNNLYPKISQKYICKVCDYECSKQSILNKHYLTRKHINLTNPNSKITLNKIYKCYCGKEYKHHSTLCNHKKKCYYKESEDKVINTIDEKKNDYKELVMKLIVENQEIKNVMCKENQELRKQITDMIPLIGNNNNNTNNVKQKFNINVFLNEKCKDAISMDQFIDTIDVSIKNLLTTKDKGLGEGLSSIIIDNMNKLSLYERPMHCTDKKRETMYIKNQEWTKDDKQEHIDNLLKCVENKQMKNIKVWMDKHPNFMENEKLQEEYIKLVKNSTSSIKDCKEKAIKKVCEKVYLEKE